MTVEFRVLGTLEVVAGGRVIPLPAGHSRVVLAGLLLRANEVVTSDQLAHWLWDGSPPNPDRAGKTIHMIMTRLRKALGEANVVATAPGGYVALVKPGQLDLARFRELTASGAHTEALSLWRGPVLTDVASDSLHHEEISLLPEERLAALELRIDDDLDHGRYLDVIPELRTLTREHPLREKFWAQLVRALYHSDQQADALAAYRSITGLLAEELGSTPSQELRDLHQRILVGSAGSTEPVPRQLPPVCPHFVGRDDELDALGALAGTGSMTIAVISGTAGVGKTTLAVRWAHAAADRFPDGQLFVNLCGFGPNEPVQPDDALRAFLDAFELPPEQIASTEDGRAAQFRSLLTGRRVLLVLDNARDAEQIRPLLPANAGCMVLVTSRHQLSGLVAKEGAQPLGLTTLPNDQAVAMLARHIGEERVRAEPEAVTDLIIRCANLPLALLVVAAQAARSKRSLRAFADELAEQPPDLGAVFSWSYRQLRPGAARLFRWLSLHPGRDISPHAAAALMNEPIAVVRRQLLELRRAHLVAGHTTERFTSHDLLRAYASELCQKHDSDQDRRAATHRVLDYYLHCADRADDLLPLVRTSVGIAPRHRPEEAPQVATAEEATAWFDTECANLVAAVDLAAEQGWPTHAWQLVFTLSRYLWLRVDFPTWLRVSRTALPSATSDPEGHFIVLCYIGGAHHELGEYEDALVWYRKAADAGSAVSALAHTRGLMSVGTTLDRLRRFEEAEQYFLAALTTVRDTGAVWLEARIRHNLGCLHNAADRPDEAKRELHLAIEMHELAGERIGVLQAHDELAKLYLEHEQFGEALNNGRAALAIAEECDNPHLQGEMLVLLGDTLDRMGSEDAATQWQKALTIFTELGSPAADEVRAKLQAVRKVCR